MALEPGRLSQVLACSSRESENHVPSGMGKEVRTVSCRAQYLPSHTGKVKLPRKGWA